MLCGIFVTQEGVLELKDKIKFLRGGISQAEFARKIDIPQQYVQRYEKGTKPLPEFFEAVRVKLGIILKGIIKLLF